MNNNYYQDSNPNQIDIFRPMSTWSHIGYDILFSIPLLGFIMLLVFAFDDSYISRRNYARSKFCKIVIIIPMVFLLIFLSAIVMNASTSTVSNAQYARFCQEFGEYSDQVTLDAANVKSNCGIRGQIINNAQMYYMTAHGYSAVKDDIGVKGYVLPAGYELDIDTPNANSNVIKDIFSYKNSNLYDTYYVTTYKDDEEKEEEDIVAYVINDGAISGYNTYGDNSSDGSASKEFYGDSSGKEYHFVTSNGEIFTLPGYSVEQSDGTIEYHIDSKRGHYYVVAGNSRKSMGSYNVNGDEIVAKAPIQASDLKNILGIKIIDETEEKLNVFTLDSSETSENTIGY